MELRYLKMRGVIRAASSVTELGITPPGSDSDVDQRLDTLERLGRLRTRAC